MRQNTLLISAFALIVVSSLLLSVSEARSAQTRFKHRQTNCGGANYYHDESANPQGLGICATDCECDGNRVCRQGTCQGEK